MLTVHAVLQPDGQVQLPVSLARSVPVPVLVTILEPLPAAGGDDAAPGCSAQATLALLRSPEFTALPKADPVDVARRIQALRDDWHDA